MKGVLSRRTYPRTGGAAQQRRGVGKQRAGLRSIAGETEHTRVLPTLSRTEDRNHLSSLRGKNQHNRQGDNTKQRAHDQRRPYFFGFDAVAQAEQNSKDPGR